MSLLQQKIEHEILLEAHRENVSIPVSVISILAEAFAEKFSEWSACGGRVFVFRNMEAKILSNLPHVYEIRVILDIELANGETKSLGSVIVWRMQEQEAGE